MAPVALIALWNAGVAAEATARVRAAIAASALTAAIACRAGIAAAGKSYEMLRSIAVLAGHNMLSALAFNAWWIVSHV